jgi:hypothetical protein
MSVANVAISETARQVLKDLARKTGQTELDILDKALDAYSRKLFLEQVNAGYAELQADSGAWSEHLGERKLWDATAMDGLDPNERWTEDGRCVNPEKRSD